MASIGAMRERVLIQRKITSSDGQGGKTVTWRDLGESFCSVATLSLGARSRYQQYQIDVTHVVSMRNMEWLDDSMRMLLITDSASAPKWFDIVSVEDDKHRKRFSTVMVRESKVKQVRRR